MILKKPSQQALLKEAMKKEIVQIHNESKQIYGAPKIAKTLKTMGYTIAEKTVGNYMREEGIKAIWVSPYTRTTIDPDFNEKLKDIINRDFNPASPNTVWVTDITYCYTLTGFVYLTSVMDLYSRKIVEWHLADNLSAQGVIIAINKATKDRNLENSVIIHSDRRG